MWTVWKLYTAFNAQKKRFFCKKVAKDSFTCIFLTNASGKTLPWKIKEILSKSRIHSEVYNTMIFHRIHIRKTIPQIRDNSELITPTMILLFTACSTFSLNEHKNLHTQMYIWKLSSKTSREHKTSHQDKCATNSV